MIHVLKMLSLAPFEHTKNKRKTKNVKDSAAFANKADKFFSNDSFSVSMATWNDSATSEWVSERRCEIRPQMRLRDKLFKNL